MKLTTSIVLSLLLMSFIGLNTINHKKSEFIKIGKQKWAIKNLDVEVFRNGDTIPEIKSTKEWLKAAEEGKPAWCYYDNNPENGKLYGKLYNWYAVNDARGLAPIGWHVPTHQEWNELATFAKIDNKNDTVYKLKSVEGWEMNKNGTDEFGFKGLPGGCRTMDGKFARIKISGSWWSATELEKNPRLAYHFPLSDYGYLESNNCGKMYGFSVRCIKD